jgi:nucleoside-diphosphate-sugar epimerase
MDSIRHTSILVTGASGFIGANLVGRLLESGAQVHALVRPSSDLRRIADLLPSIHLHKADLSSARSITSLFRRIRPEILINAAFPGGHPASPQLSAQLAANGILAATSLLEAAADVGIRRFINLGSSLEYGSRSSPLTESDLPDPYTGRGMAKAATTLLCRQYARIQRLPLVTLRLFSVYGYWEGPSRLIPTAILAALKGGELNLTTAGFHRDLIYIEDVVEACLVAMRTETPCGDIINIGSGLQWSNEEVVEMVQQLAGSRIRIHPGTYPPQPSDCPHWVADIGKARESLGWQPRHTLRAGLEKTIRWMRAHEAEYRSWGASASTGKMSVSVGGGV